MNIQWTWFPFCCFYTDVTPLMSKELCQFNTGMTSPVRLLIDKSARKKYQNLAWYFLGWEVYKSTRYLVNSIHIYKRVTALCLFLGEEVWHSKGACLDRRCPVWLWARHILSLCGTHGESVPVPSSTKPLVTCSLSNNITLLWCKQSVRIYFRQKSTPFFFNCLT